MEVVVSLSFCYLTITTVHLGYTLSGRQVVLLSSCQNRVLFCIT